jgi:superfamily II DNA or RNA helicase
VLTSKLKRFFSAAVRRRGDEYYYGGHVKKLTAEGDRRVQADVAGHGDAYAVTLDVARDAYSWTITGSCECPFVDEYGDPCKHIWAVLRAAETCQAFGKPPKSVYLMLADGWLDDEESFGDLEAEGPIPIGSLLSDPAYALRQLFANRFKPRTRRKPQESTPRWVQALRQLPRASGTHDVAAAARSAPVEPVYIMEPGPTRPNQRLLMSLAQRTVTAKGTPGRLKSLTLRMDDIPHLPNELDRRICLMLLGGSDSDRGYRRYSYSRPERTTLFSFYVHDEIRPVILPLLFQTGRFCIRPEWGDEPIPLKWDDGPPWEFALAMVSSESGGTCTFQPILRRGAERREIQPDDCLLDGDPGLYVHKEVVAGLSARGCLSWYTMLNDAGPLRIPRGDRDRLLKELVNLGNCPPIEWPEEWQITEVRDAAPKPELHLRIESGDSDYGRARYAFARVEFRYGDFSIAADRAATVALDAEKHCQIVRQLDAEQAFLGRLFELGMEPASAGDPLRIRHTRLPHVVATLMDEGWTVLGNRALFRRPGDFAVDFRSGIDWFELNGQVDFEGQAVALPELLAAYRKGERFVRLGDGSMGMLPQEWLARHGAILEFGRAADGAIRFARSQIGVIDALLAELPEARFDESLSAARAKLHAFSGIRPQTAPAGFVGTLRPYQEQGLAWLGFLNDFQWGGCLADDMGLGKTIQVLALLLDRKRRGDAGPSLAVVPKSVVFNWIREAERFTPDLRVLEYTGTERKDLHDAFAANDLIITTYGTLRKDIELLRRHEFSYVVLDEAQMIKNPSSQSAKATRLLRSRNRLAMTGTPVENSLGDLWSLFEFLNPGMLGSSRAFKGAFGGGAAGRNGKDLDMLHRMLRPFILRRTKDQVTPELPPRVEQTIECELLPKQRAYYQELRDYYRASLLGRIDKVGLARSKVHVLEALLRLRQAACHPGLIDQGKINGESAKLEALLEMVTEVREEGHKALVFSQFTSLLAIVRAKLDEAKTTYEYLDGQTTDRRERVDRFQSDPGCGLFLISLKAGGLGLNLTAADYVFILDPWWNPAVEAQAIDRTHRIGQDKKIIAYRLIARDTVESKILELQKTKRELAGAIITEANSLIQDLTKEDLALLLS